MPKLTTENPKSAAQTPEASDFDQLFDRRPDDGPFYTAEAAFWTAVRIKAKVVTTGLRGGDSGHGGFVEIRLKGDSDMFGDPDEQVSLRRGELMFIGRDEVVLRTQGDGEMLALRDALRFVVAELDLRLPVDAA